MSPAVTSPGPRASRRSVTGSSAVHVQHEVLEVQDEVGDVFLHPGDRVELVERFVEAHLRDRGAGDRREQRAAQAVAERVAEAGLERRDDELLRVAFGLAGLDLGTLDDEHGVSSRSGASSARTGRAGGYLE